LLSERTLILCAHAQEPAMRHLEACGTGDVRANADPMRARSGTCDASPGGLQHGRADVGGYARKVAVIGDCTACKSFVL
jgi:hypothetical protein